MSYIKLVASKLRATALMAALIFGGIVFSALSYAHHSATQYDFNKGTELEGKVVLADIANPHLELILEIANEDGAAREVQFEGSNRNGAYRGGWRPGMISEGDTITIRYAPMRNGEDGGYVQSITLEDGTQF